MFLSQAVHLISSGMYLLQQAQRTHMYTWTSPHFEKDMKLSPFFRNSSKLKNPTRNVTISLVLHKKYNLENGERFWKYVKFGFVILTRY